MSSSQSPLSPVSVYGENCALAPQGHFRAHSVGLGAPPLPTVRGAAGPLIGLAKRETGRARSKEKGAWMRSGAVALRAEGGRRIGACSDLALPSGTLGPSAIPSTAVPWWMVRKLPGCKDAFELLRFSCLALRRSGDFRHQCSTGSSFRAFRYALPWRSWKLQLGPMLKLSLTTGQRQRKSAQRVSRTSPGWRGSQGPDVSLSDRRKGSPTFPRRNMFSFPPGAVSPTAPVRRSTSVPSKSPHHEQDKKECILWQSI